MTFTWNGQSTTSSTWSTPQNWSGGAPVADSSADTIVFAGAARTTNQNDVVTSLGGLQFAAGAAAFTLQSGTAFSLGSGGISNSSSATQTIANSIMLSADQTWAASGQITASGVISGSGNLTKTGAGTLELSGTNTYTGTTTVSGGTLKALTNAALGNTPTLIFDGGAWMAGNFENARPITLQSGGAILQTFSISNLSQTGVISGGGNLTVQGTVLMRSANAYTGATIIPAYGQLHIYNAMGLGLANTTPVTVSGSLTLHDVIVNNQAVNLAGLLAGTGSAMLSGNVTLTGANSSLSAGTANDTLTLSGVIAGGFGIAKNGGGTVILTGANTYTGATTINAGTLTASHVTALGGAGGTTVVRNATLEITVANVNEAVSLNGGTLKGTGTAASLTGTVTLGASNPPGTTSMLNATTSTDKLTLSGTITETGGSFGLIKNGAGTVVLSGDNSYDGDTTVSTGTLQIGDGGSTGSIMGNIVNSATVTFDRSGVVAYGGILSGTGSLTKNGGGTLTLSGANSYSGITTIQTGTLIAADANALGAANNTTVATNATLHIQDKTIGETVTVNGGTLAGSGNAMLSGGLTLGVGSKVEAPAANDTLTLSAVIAGANGLVKIGAGKVILSNANSYTGGTIVSSGTLQIGNNSSAGSILGDIASDGNVSFYRSDSVAFTGVITGGGSVTKNGSATLTLANANSYGGGTTVSSGTLQIGNGSNAGWILGNIANEGNVTFYRSDDMEFPGIISGSGSVTKNGSATLTLSGANSYAGTTAIDAGTLRATHASALGAASSTTVANGATLHIDNVSIGSESISLNGGTLKGSTQAALSGSMTLGAGSALDTPTAGDTLTVLGAITGVFGLQKIGAGRVVLYSASPYAGGTTVQAGTLALNGGGATAGQGLIDVAAGAAFEAPADMTIGNVFHSDGVVKVDPVNSIVPGVTYYLTFQNNVSGAGAYKGNVRFSGHYSPGNGTTPATTTFDNHLQIAGTAIVDVKLGGVNPGQYDQVIVGGTATLGGTLNVTLINNFQPGLGDVFTIMTFGAQSGTFNTINLPSLGVGKELRATYKGNYLFLSVVGTATDPRSRTA